MASYDPEQFENDPAKAAWRAKLRDSIRTIFNGKTRDKKAVFLTGPGLSEHREVYSPLGLRPANVHGVEIDPEAYARAEAENATLNPEQRIRLFNQDIKEHIVAHRPFDIVSLDWLQTYGPTVIKSLDAILNPIAPCLADRSVVIVNVQGRREHPKYQRRLAALVGLGGALEIKAASRTVEMMENQYGFKKEEHPEFPLKRLEGKFLTKIFLGDYMNRLEGTHVSSPEYMNLMRHGLFHEVAIRAGFPIAQLGIAGLFGEGDEGILSEDSKKSLRRIVRGVTFNEDSVDALWVAYLLTLENKTLEEGFAKAYKSIPKELLAGSLLERKVLELSDSVKGAVLNAQKSRSIIHYDTYSYVSASGTPMESYIFGLERDIMDPPIGRKRKRIHKTVEDMEDIARALGREGFLLEKIFGKSIDGSLDGAYMQLIERVLDNQRLLKKFRTGQRLLNVVLNSPEYRSAGEVIYRLMEHNCTSLDILQRTLSQQHDSILEVMGKEKSRLGDYDSSQAEETKANTHTNNFPLLVIPEQQLEESKASPTAQQPLQIVPLPKPVGLQTGLSESDKSVIRELFIEGSRPKEIYESFFKDASGVTMQMVAAICARTHDSWTKKAI